MESKRQTIPLRSRRVRGLCALLGLALTTLSVAPAARAVDIVNRATAQLTLPSLAQPLTLTSDAVTTRVETPTGLPFRLTEQVSAATAQPGQEVLLTLTVARLTNSVALPFAVTVNNQPQALLLVQAVIPVNTSLARVEDGSAGLALFHVVGDPEQNYATIPPVEMNRVDRVAWGFPQLPMGTNVTVRFSVTVNPNGDGTVRNAGAVWYAETANGPPLRVNSNPVQFEIAGAPLAIRTFRDTGFTTPITSVLLNQPLYFQAEAAACNTRPDVIETNLVIITSAKTGDRETLPVVETGPNTGVFRVLRGLTPRDSGQHPVEAENGFIETARGDSLSIEFVGCGARRVVTLLLIDPAGVVFDSRGNLPIEGARVTILDATTGLPTAVFGPDGLTPAPNSIVTGADGRYVFPTVRVGVYRLTVTPPPGYHGPTTLPVSALPAGRTIHASGSFGRNFPVNALTGAVMIDYPLDALASGGVGMFLQKTGSRATAEIGDAIDYTVAVRNVSGHALPGVRILDGLPAGFAYLTGSARFESAALQPTTTGGGPRLEFLVGAIARDATVTLTYRVRVGPGALQGNGINSAQAISGGAPVFTSNVASYRVQLQGGVFSDKAFIIGKVFVDKNGNRIQDAGEPGIPGVRIFLEDGSYAVTDGEGKYSFYGLSPRTHVVKLDGTTLPQGAKMLVLATRNAGVGTSRFADLKRGELHKADFAEGSATPEILAEVAARRKKAGALNGEIEAQFKSELTRDGQPLPLGDRRAQPASGLIGAPRPAPAPAADPAAPRATTNTTNTTPASATNATPGVVSEGAPLTAAPVVDEATTHEISPAPAATPVFAIAPPRLTFAAKAPPVFSVGAPGVTFATLVTTPETIRPKTFAIAKPWIAYATPDEGLSLGEVVGAPPRVFNLTAPLLMFATHSESPGVSRHPVFAVTAPQFSYAVPGCEPNPAEDDAACPLALLRAFTITAPRLTAATRAHAAPAFIVAAPRLTYTVPGGAPTTDDANPALPPAPQLALSRAFTVTVPRLTSAAHAAPVFTATAPRVTFAASGYNPTPDEVIRAQAPALPSAPRAPPFALEKPRLTFVSTATASPAAPRPSGFAIAPPQLTFATTGAPRSAPPSVLANAPGAPAAASAAPSSRTAPAAERLTTNDVFTTLLPAAAAPTETSGLPPAPAAPAPLLNLGAALSQLDNTLGFVDFKDRDTLPMPQATVRVKGTQGAKFELLVNGAELPASRIGRRTEIADKKLQVWDFIGVNFKPGENTLSLTQRDPFGNARGTVQITLIAPDRLGIIRLRLPKELPAADGRTAVKIGVELVDAKGVPVTARTALTLETSLGRWEVDDLDKKEPGIQVFLEGGRAEYLLVPPMEPGDAHLVISSGSMKGEATLSFLPELRPLLAVGLLEGQINLRNLSSRDVLPARSRDGFEEELRGFSIGGNDAKLNAAGRAAFYLKGRIKGDALLTASYDSDKISRERLFRDIQPDEFYPVYGDSSARGFDAQSTGKFYVRVDKRKCYALYGDYVTQTPVEARSLGNYNRSATGVKTHLEQSWLNANAWVAHDSARQVIEELPANGTSGPFQFRTGDGLVNSEKVEVLTRDRQQPALVLKTVSLARFTDYEFEPFTGRILFKAPIPSLDANLNPVSIRVTYEVDQGGEKFFVYGADAQFKPHARVEVGVSGARDENPQAPYQLYGANATVKLAARTFVVGEVAWSAAGELRGTAERVELRHQDDKNELRVYWGRAGNTFSNSAAILSAGRVEAGVKFVRKLDASTRLLGQAIDTSSLGGGSRRGVLVGLEHTFDNQIRAEVGGRYSRETGGSAGPALGFPGVTQAEVASLRAKLALPIPAVKGGTVYGEFENDIRRTERRMLALGGDYQVNAKTKIYARHEFISSVGSPFELNSVQQQNTTVVGVDTDYMKDGKLFNEYRMKSALTGREAEAATGLRNGWSVAEGLRLNTTLERVSPLVRGGQSEATAGTAALEYTKSLDWKLSTRLELRTSRQNDSLLHTFAYAQRLNQDWTFLGRTIVHVLQNNTPAGGEKFQGRIQGGLAWRQTETNVWNALLKMEYKREEDSTLPAPAAALARDVAIFSAHAHYQPSARWFASAHYASKAVWESSLGRNTVYYAHLLAGRASFELSKRWDLGLNASALASGDLKSVQYGFGPELGFVLKDNLRFGIGYNIFGFRDRDLGAEDYTSRGLYLAFRLKFDESLLHRLSTGGKTAE